jgi:RHS repeat-associated protein
MQNIAAETWIDLISEDGTFVGEYDYDSEYNNNANLFSSFHEEYKSTGIIPDGAYVLFHYFYLDLVPAYRGMDNKFTYFHSNQLLRGGYLYQDLEPGSYYLHMAASSRDTSAPQTYPVKYQITIVANPQEDFDEKIRWEDNTDTDGGNGDTDDGDNGNTDDGWTVPNNDDDDGGIGSYGGDDKYLVGLTPIGTEQKTTYEYNVQSQVTQIKNNNDLFRQDLTYDFIGNISQMRWAQAGQWKTYDFTYDNLSRLKSANYTGNGNFSTAYSYDKHGNMMTLQRYGKKGVGTNVADYGLIDNLTMTYNGNQMKAVNDAAADIALNTSMDFKNYSNVATEYTYNRNGAMVKDLNKGISAITYNSLNLPQTVDIKNRTAEGRNEYTYSAGGQKLRAVQRWNPNYNSAPVIGSDINVGSLTMSTTTDYVGNIIYENGNLKRILVDGGYYESGKYYFYINDHLGNNRIVADAAASVVQSTQYYPFGMSFADAMGQDVQPYKYNGKELDGRNGLNMYDYSARWKHDWYFTTVDPMAEKYYSISPYAYVANNPMRLTDPTGMVIDDANALEWNINEIKIGFMIWLLEQNNTEGKYDDSISRLKGTIKDMDKMKNSKNVYYLEEAKGTTGGFSYNKSKKKFRVSYLGISNFIHEVTHGGQYERGEIGLYDDEIVSGMIGDIHDEIEAYRTEFAYLGKLTFDSTVKNVWDINVNWVRNQTDGLGNYLYRSMNQGYINKDTQYWYYRLTNINQPITISTHPADLCRLKELEEFTFNKDE